MMTRLQERNLRRVIKRGGEIQLPGIGGTLVEVDVTRHQTFVAVNIQLQPEPARPFRPYYGPAREVYPLAAELLDALVASPAAEVAHG